ncbi:MAG: hypothetical protein JW878_06605 [Methanomicrobia archaeon]|nr:hypothetical protein [Methanomicrobia archaeon]
MEWYVEITGESFDLEELSKSLNSPELCITQEGNAFILKSTDFNILKDANEVRTRASEILSLINGSARLALEMRKPLEVGSVVEITDDGKRRLFDLIEFAGCCFGRVSVSTTIVKANGTVQEQESHQADPIVDWIAIARYDTNVATVLRLFNKNLDWVNLYRIYEVIESDVGGIDNIIEEEWTTKRTIKRFKYTANSPDAIGDESRHGKKLMPPKDPMTFPEARSLIKTLAHKWLSSKER